MERRLLTCPAQFGTRRNRGPHSITRATPKRLHGLSSLFFLLPLPAATAALQTSRSLSLLSLANIKLFYNCALFLSFSSFLSTSFSQIPLLRATHFPQTAHASVFCVCVFVWEVVGGVRLYCCCCFCCGGAFPCLLVFSLARSLVLQSTLLAFFCQVES